MKNNQNNHHHITISLAYSGTLLMLLLFSVGFLSPPEVNAAAITCSSGVSGCHFNTTVKDGTGRNVPSGRFTGSHVRHSGYSTGVKRQYLYACTRCHPSSGYTNSHQTGFKNITGSSLPGNRYSAGKKIANTNSPSFGNCSNIYCHSSGRASGMGQVQYSSVRWGGTKTCLGCHGGRNGSNNPARSVGNFTLTTTHSQHLKYPFGDINCQICHSKTATNATTLKNFTGVQRHANGVRDVTFTGVSYGSYTSYKTSGVDIGKCTNISCHGGKSRSGWSASTSNNTHTCTHCHGQPQAANIPTNNTNRKMYAPGWINGGYTGTSTDQVSASSDPRVGGHFVHLSSVYIAKIKCNECHYVPADPFDVSNNHMNGPRYSSQSLYFAQASTARILIGVASGSTPAQLASFAGYTSGTASLAATCSSVYCHGNRLKNNITSGTARKPRWNQDLTATPATATSCGRCHGFPPLDGSLHSAGDTTCSSCHSHVATGVNPTSFVNKALHINGKVEAAGGDCTSVSCHGAASLASPIAGGLGGPATRRNVVAEHKNTWSHKRSTGGGVPANVIVTKDDCIVCHMEGDKATGGTTGVHKDGYIDLRDPDSGLHIKNVTWNGATPGAYVEGTTDLRFVQFSRNLAATLESDTNFLVIAAIQQNHCLKCHDTNGANDANARVTTGGTAMRPFGVAITNHAAPLGSNGSGNVVDVNKSFLTSNATYHPVRGKQNNGFADINLLSAPWNVKTGAGTAAVYGPLMSCWDCHAPAGAAGAQTRTVTAHGGPATLRSPIWAGGSTAAANLCLVCHLASAYPSTNGTHGASSAFTGGRANMGSDMPLCHNCHSTFTNARPVRAEDVHGFNDKTPNSANSKWPSGSRPYAFFRTSQLGDWAPASAAGDALLRTSTCNSGGCSNNNMNGANGVVGTGGTY